MTGGDIEEETRKVCQRKFRVQRSGRLLFGEIVPVGFFGRKLLTGVHLIFIPLQTPVTDPLQSLEEKHQWLA